MWLRSLALITIVASTALAQPPAEFANDGGVYRSPLRFYDGREAKDANDWPARRAEILSRWHSMMGKWPALLENPKVELIEEKRREDFTQKQINIEVAPGQMTKGYLLMPDGAGPFPAVLVVFYDPETSANLLDESKRTRAFAYDLVKRGVVTLSIGTPARTARDPDLGGVPCQPLSYYAYVAANCHTILSKQPNVDAKRIAVMGHSYGGKWAMFASCLYEKFAAGVWSDPGIVFDETRPNVNYWEPWYLGLDEKLTRKPGVPTAENPRTGAYRRMIDAGHDLHELHALMAPRPFLVSGGSEDPPMRWKALNHPVTVNRLLGYEDRVQMTNRPEHSPSVESNEQAYAFLERHLKIGR